MKRLWIIEKRVAGVLDLSAPQPEKYFGGGAITGLTEDEMAQAVFRAFPDAVLSGTNIPQWPSVFHAGFVARRKTW